MKNGEVSHRVDYVRNILHTMKRRKANWIGHILRRNCFLKHVKGRKKGGLKLREDGEEEVSS